MGTVGYKIWKKKFKNKQGVEFEKYYACKHTNHNTTTEMIVEQIQESCSLTQADALAAIASLSAILKSELAKGNSVKLDGIGTFNASITSQAMDSPNEIRKITVKGGRVTFKADKKLREALKDLSFKKSKE
ncbi:MAG: HU family DNA-binding protein [Bacteroidales bacterium]|jgi:predicted histone-like DNA-binding protein|nr:HU family DNA-binding protein [Bacteroidales bacterium]